MTVTITGSLTVGGAITPTTSDTANPVAIGLAGGGLMVIADNGSTAAEGEFLDGGPSSNSSTSIIPAPTCRRHN